MVDKGAQPVLCLDEFEEFTVRPAEFRREFFLTLRACGQQGLSILTGSRRRLSELTDPTDVVSPFYNTFPLINLGPFSDVDADAFVSRSRPGMPAFTEPEREAIRAFAKGQPLALQLGCFHVLEARQNGESIPFALARADEEMKGMLSSWGAASP
jgi:hypothetical protein